MSDGDALRPTAPPLSPPGGVAERFRLSGPLAGSQSWLGQTEGGRRVVVKRGPYDSRPRAGSARVLEVLHEEGGPWLVREFLEEPSLEEVLRRGPLPLAEALGHLRTLLSLLVPYHDQGAHHGRVKPSNLLAGRLTDAGPLVAPGDLADLRYQAPEQAGALPGPAGPPADLYAAGAILYEMLRGRPAFAANTLAVLLRLQLAGPVPAVDQGDLALDAFLARLLAKDPRDRYQHAAAALADLDRLEPGFVPGVHESRNTLASPALVGRDAALERLLGRLEDGGALALVAPAGAGKTRLVDEALRRATARGRTVLRCRAGTLQALEELVQGLSPAEAASLRERLGDGAPAAVAALPALEPLLGPASDPGPDSHAWPRTRAALARLLNALAPAVLAFEDLHRASPELLAVLDQAAPANRVLFLLTSREVVPLEAEALHLPPLARDEVGLLARSMAGPLPPEALEAVADLAEGNPFLAAETLSGMVSGGALEAGPEGWSFHPCRLPAGDLSHRAERLVAGRMDRLSPRCAEAMSTAALLGREFEASLLEALVEDPRPLLEEARGAHLVLPVDGDRWVFVHDRLHEQALARTDGETRRRTHLAVARRLEAVAPHRVAERARHLFEAGERAEGRPLALQAARAARSRNALDTAASSYELALREAPDDLKVLEALGDVRRLAGCFPEAERCYAEVLARLPEGDDAARVLGSLGAMAFQVGDLPRASGHLLRALDLLGHPIPRGPAARAAALAREVALLASPPPARPRPLEPRERLAARLLDELAYVLAYRDGYGLIWANLRGLNLTRRRLPSREFGTALASHAIAVLYVPALVGRARESSRRAVEIQALHGTPYDRACARAREAAIDLFTDAPREGLRKSGEAMAVLARSGVPYETHMVTYNHALALFRVGRLEEARALALDNHRAARAAGNGLGAAYSLRVLGLTGPLERDWIDATARLGDHRHVSLLLEEARGVLHLQEGRPDLARPRFESARDRARALGDVLDEHWAEIHLAAACRREAEALEPGFGQRRRDLLAAARRSSRRALGLARAAYRVHLPRALRETAHLAAERGQDARARRALEEGAAVAAGMGMAYDEAHCLVELAAFDRRRGRPGRAVPEAARRLLERTGSTWELPGGPLLHLRPAPAERFDQVLSWGRALASALSEARVLDTARRAAEALLRCGCRCLGPLAAEEAAPRLAEPAESDVLSALVIPLRVRQRPVAHLYCFHREIRGFFGAEELSLAGFVAALAGAALENSELLWEVADREARLEALFTGFGVGIAVVGPDGRIVEANRTLKDLLGTSCQGRFSDLADPADRPCLEAAVQDVLRGGRPSCLLEARFLRPDGSPVWAQVSGRAVAAADGRARLALLGVSDVSHRRLAQIARFQETERRLLAAEVHDVISQPLVALHYRLDMVTLEGEAVPAGEVSAAAGMARALLEEVRSMIFQLRTPALDRVLLGDALREALGEMTAGEGPALEARILPEVDAVRGLPALFAHRIVVEALANVRRHARAGRVQVRLAVRDSALVGLVADDGRGFDPGRVSSRSFGLQVMRERAELLGGTVKIRSSAGRGTVVRFTIPLPGEDPPP